MKCISCETEINPKWKHAIDINVCPFCGKHIMEEHLKNCLASLAIAMDEMQKYPEQLDDWMLSNHNYIKTDSPNLKSYLPIDTIKELRREIDDAEFQEKKSSTVKIKLPDGTEQEVLVEKRQSDAKTSSFFERAEALKGAGKTSGKGKAPDEPEPPKSIAEKTQRLKAMAEEIRSEGSKAIINESGLASMITPGQMEESDPEAVAQLQALIDSGSDIVASGLPAAATSGSGDDDDIPSVVLNMATRAQKNPANAMERDMKTLQEMQNKVNNAQKRLASGKGGFSRA